MTQTPTVLTIELTDALIPGRASRSDVRTRNPEIVLHVEIPGSRTADAVRAPE
jgi:hypothetical protein